MKLYRFSPLETLEDLKKAIVYVVNKSNKLCLKTIGKEMPITSLTIFAHYPNEYEALVKMALELGEPHNENNGPRMKLKNPITVDKHIISFVRIRKPDPYRTQVGCCDFDTDYISFKKDYLSANLNLRLIERTDYEMIEFHNPDFDVFAYVVSN